MTDWVITLSFVKRYLERYNRSEVETLFEVRVGWETLPVLKVD